MADLEAISIARFRERAIRSNRLGSEILEEDDQGLIEKLRLCDGAYLKRAAVLLFHPEPETFVTGTSIKIGYFKTDSDLLFHDEIHGGLLTQVDKTMDLLLTKYLKAVISYEGVQRVETFPVPANALREALLNAVAHKDYGSGIPIQISVYDDKILFWNNGRLPENWTIDNLTSKHASQPYNPDIANVFFRAGMIEAWGRGIEKMVADCLAHGVPGPVLRYESTGLWVEFAVDSTEKSTEKMVGKTGAAIIQAMRETPETTIADLSMKLSRSTSAIEKQIRKLQEMGVIQRVGADKGGHWEVLK